MAKEIFNDGTVTYSQRKEMVDFAEGVLLKYFEMFSPKRPGDLEDDFCGMPDAYEMLTNCQGRWRETPFYPALGRLVSNGLVTYVKDGSGDWWYSYKEPDTSGLIP